MPTYQFNCEVCGKSKKDWRPDGHPPKYCGRICSARGKAGKSQKHIKWPITPEIREEIRKIYTRETGNGQVAALAKRLGYPRWRITRTAINMGLTAKQHKEPDWSDPEILMLEHLSYLSPDRIRARMAKAGYHRSIIGIVLKRKRMNFLKNLEGQSSRSLAECFGVDSHFITRAIKEGRLKARMRQTDRTEVQGGDIYYIKDQDVRDYVINNVHEIDIRKVDKYWFVDLLAG